MKRLFTLMTVFAILLVSVAAVGAQDDTGTDTDTDTQTDMSQVAPFGLRDRLHNWMDTILEVTGLTVEQIQAGIAEGQTLAEVIEANGGDVEAVRQALIDAGMANYESLLTERIDTLLAHELGSRMPLNGRGLQIAQYVLDATGLTLEQIQAGMEAGQTLAEVIEANGGNVDEVTQALIDAATEQFPNADADTIAARIDTLLNTVLGSRMPFNGRGLQIAQYILDATGLTVEQIQAGMDAGQTLAEVIEANGGNVDEVTQALLDAATEQFPNVDADTLAEHIDTLLNTVLGARMRDFDGDMDFFGRGNQRNFGPGGRGNRGNFGGQNGNNGSDDGSSNSDGSNDNSGSSTNGNGGNA